MNPGKVYPSSSTRPPGEDAHLQQFPATPASTHPTAPEIPTCRPTLTRHKRVSVREWHLVMLSIAMIIIFLPNGASTHRQPLTHSSAPAEYCCDTASRLERESGRHHGTYVSPRDTHNKPQGVSFTPTPCILHSRHSIPTTTHTHPVPYTLTHTPSSKSHSRHVRSHKLRSRTCHINKLPYHTPPRNHYTHCSSTMHPLHLAYHHTISITIFVPCRWRGWEITRDRLSRQHSALQPHIHLHLTQPLLATAKLPLSQPRQPYHPSTPTPHPHTPLSRQANDELMATIGNRGLQRAREEDDLEPLAAAPPQRQRTIDAEEESDGEENDKENMFSFNLDEFMGGMQETLFAEATQMVADGGEGEVECEYSIFKVAMYREEGAGPFDAASAGSTLKELLGGSAIPMQTIGEDTCKGVVHMLQLQRNTQVVKLTSASPKARGGWGFWEVESDVPCPSKISLIMGFCLMRLGDIPIGVPLLIEGARMALARFFLRLTRHPHRPHQYHILTQLQHGITRVYLSPYHYLTTCPHPHIRSVYDLKQIRTRLTELREADTISGVKDASFGPPLLAAIQHGKINVYSANLGRIFDGKQVTPLANRLDITFLIESGNGVKICPSIVGMKGLVPKAMALVSLNLHFPPLATTFAMTITIVFAIALMLVAATSPPTPTPTPHHTTPHHTTPHHTTPHHTPYSIPFSAKPRYRRGTAGRSTSRMAMAAPCKR